jgi:tetratricopeptide (TPR) repeat protein
MDCHLQRVIELNNRGALHIEAGAFDEAVSELTEALQQSKLIKRPLRWSTNNMDYASSSTKKESYVSLILKDVKKALTLDTEDVEDSPEGGFVYGHPIRIERNPYEIPELAPRTLMFLSFAVIFNLAISYQLQSCCNKEEYQHDEAGGEEEQQRQLLLEKSKHLYELGYRILQSDEDVSFSVRISLALANNLGQVLKNLHEYQKADMCFERLLSTVMFLIECGADDGELHAIEGFIRNTSHLVLTKPTASAA